VVGRQPYAPAAFTPGEIPGTHFQVLSGVPRKKSPVTPPGIDPGTLTTTLTHAPFFSDRMSYIVLRGRWCNIIVLNMLAPLEEKVVIKRQYEELEQVFDHFPQYYTKILLGDFYEILG